MFRSRFESRFEKPGGRTKGGGRTAASLLLNPVAWLDASDTLTITESSGSVSQWNDKSGNNYHDTQGTGSLQPITNASTQNGKNIIDFADDRMDMNAGLYTLPASAYEGFIVSRRAAESGTNMALLGMHEGASGNRVLVYYTSTAGVIGFKSDTGAGSIVTDSGNTNTDFNIINFSFNGTTGLSLAVNGGAAVTGTGGSAEDGIDRAWTGGSVGITSNLTGSVGEMILYNRVLSATERPLIKNYLSNKWAVTL